MAGKRKQHTPAYNAQVALAPVKGDRTVNELASQYGVLPTLIHTWKKQLLAGAEQVFSNGSKASPVDAEVQQAELFEHIGRLPGVSRTETFLWLRSARPKPIDLDLIRTLRPQS